MPLVRAVLAHHLDSRAASGTPRVAPLDGDPNALLDASLLAAHLAAVERTRGAQGVRALADHYVALWARTFKGLVRHLRGRPERALSLFAAEVYPFLRGDRLAARVEEVGPGSARLVLATDLPAAYLEGLVVAFVGLSGATVRATLEGNTCSITWRLRGIDRVARIVQVLAALRIPLVVAATLSVVMGFLLSLKVGHPWQPWRSAAVLVGALSAQAAANAWHDLQRPHPAGPLGPVRPSARLMRTTVWLGYPAAGACGLALAWDRPFVLLFAAAGLVVSALFARFRDRGFGPLLAGLTYGPLLPLGVLVALGPIDVAHLGLLLYTLPLGLMAAAILYIDDLADRPLDEAGGQRTLIVRMAPRNRLVGFAGLAAGAVAVCAILYGAAPLPSWITVAGLAAVAGLLIWHVRGHLDEPRRLAPARVGTFMLLLATAAAAMDALGATL